MEEEKKKEVKIKIYRPQPGLQEKIVASNVDVVFCGGSVSSGKALSVSELVLTPSGWKKNGDLRVGDEICTPYNGNQKITALFPQGVVDIYELETLDGRKCECTLDHLWRVRTAKQVRNYHAHHNQQSNYFTLTTKDIIARMERGERISIPLSGAIEFPGKDLPLNPYVLGTLIGDGRLVTGAKSSLKFIPDIYLWGSIQQRRDLLAGLMDAGGVISEAGNFEISVMSEHLKDDIVHLTRSLGYAVYASGRKKGKRAVNVCYTIRFRAEDRIFHSEEHNERYDKSLASTDKKYRRHATHITIKSIKFLKREEAQCLYIDDRDHLYITRDFIVTHNSFGLILSMAEPIQDPNFRAVFLRRNLNETKVAGGLFEDTKKVFASYIRSAKESDNPRITFKSGAFIDYTHISDETPANLLERIRGWQYPCIVMDEGTSFAWTTFRLLFSRNRGTSKWTNKFRLSCNPKKSSWIRTFIKDYIGPDGYIRPDWDGRVRYFYIKGKRVEDVVWGDSKEEVYAQCRYEINEALDKFQKKGLEVDFRSLIKSFTFYLGSTAENKAMIGNDASYLGSVAAMGEAEARANLLGNWNVDEEEDDEEAPIKASDAKKVFTADPQMNNDKWITVDLADTGTDNTLILVWNGFHVMDYKILMQSTPKINAEAIAAMADKHGIGDTHIIYDAIRAAYMIDYLPQAQGFISYRAPMGKYSRMVDNLKAECYMRLVNMINNQRLSFDDSVAQCCYRHINLQPITFRTEFEEECMVVRFIEAGSGRKKLMNKKEMNAKLGKHRSMDLLDSCAMRMYPVLGYEYGEELEKTAVESKNDTFHGGHTVDVYDPSVWA